MIHPFCIVAENIKFPSSIASEQIDILNYIVDSLPKKTDYANAIK